jgi:hypothetical protein
LIDTLLLDPMIDTRVTDPSINFLFNGNNEGRDAQYDIPLLRLAHAFQRTRKKEHREGRQQTY